MVYYLHQKDICTDPLQKKQIVLKRTCNCCETDIIGLWEYSPKVISIYSTFYDDTDCKIVNKPNHYAERFLSFAIENNMHYMDLNAFVLDVQSLGKYEVSWLKTMYEEPQAIYPSSDHAIGMSLRDLCFLNVKQMEKLMVVAVADQDALTKELCQTYEKCKPLTSKQMAAAQKEYYGIYDWQFYINKKSRKIYQDYIKSKEYSDICETKKEIDDFIKMKTCPLCGEKLSDLYALVSLPQEKETKKTLCEKRDSFLKDYCRRKETEAREHSLSVINANAIVTYVPTYDTSDLRKYMKALFTLEKIVLESTDRLTMVYSQYLMAEKDLFRAEKIREYEGNRKRNEIIERYESSLKTKFFPSVTIENIAVQLPEKPQEPIEPEKPILQQPRWFNKKRVAAENELKTQEYLAKLEDYKQAKKDYLNELAKYYDMLDERMQERNRQYEELVQKEKEAHQQKIKKLKAKRDKELACLVAPNEVPEKIKLAFLKENTEEAEAFLAKAVKHRAELYACDVVYEKYRNIAAIATFCEYLDSGRCQELVGANGAYNLFENEVRQNLIISKLDEIIDELESIQDNQYLMYSTMKTVNANLIAIDKSMNKALTVLSDIDSNIKNIQENTAVIAYNTERTAYYAKKNAELTNALGYLVALS